MARITLRPIRDGDEPFLRAVYASTREAELAVLPPSMHDAFTNSQYDAQRAHYQRVYPGATWSVIEADGVPVGRFVVDRTIDPWLLVDIALLAAARGRGVGTSLVRELQDAATRAGTGIDLSVRVDNALAQKLYARLGFVPRATGDHDHTHISMAYPGGKGGLHDPNGRRSDN